MEIIIVISAVLVVICLAFYSHKRKRDTFFDGVVTDKERREIRDSGDGASSLVSSRTSYVLKIQTSSGDVIDWNAGKDIYETVRAGDHVSKLKGTADIAITPQVAAYPQPIQQSPIQEKDSCQSVQVLPPQIPSAA